MALKALKRLSTHQVRDLGGVVEKVAATGEPVVIRQGGEDRAVIIALRDFRARFAGETPSTSEREQVRAALRAAGLLSEPTAQEIAEIEAWRASHPPEEQARILADLRSLRLVPPLSEIILRNRDRGVE